MSEWNFLWDQNGLDKFKWTNNVYGDMITSGHIWGGCNPSQLEKHQGGHSHPNPKGILEPSHLLCTLQNVWTMVKHRHTVSLVCDGFDRIYGTANKQNCPLHTPSVRSLQRQLRHMVSYYKIHEDWCNWRVTFLFTNHAFLIQMGCLSPYVSSQTTNKKKQRKRKEVSKRARGKEERMQKREREGRL